MLQRGCMQCKICFVLRTPTVVRSHDCWQALCGAARLHFATPLPGRAAVQRTSLPRHASCGVRQLAFRARAVLQRTERIGAPPYHDPSLDCMETYRSTPVALNRWRASPVLVCLQAPTRPVQRTGTPVTTAACPMPWRLRSRLVSDCLPGTITIALHDGVHRCGHMHRHIWLLSCSAPNAVDPRVGTGQQSSPQSSTAQAGP